MLSCRIIYDLCQYFKTRENSIENTNWSTNIFWGAKKIVQIKTFLTRANYLYNMALTCKEKVKCYRWLTKIIYGADFYGHFYVIHNVKIYKLYFYRKFYSKVKKQEWIYFRASSEGMASLLEITVWIGNKIGKNIHTYLI